LSIPPDGLGLADGGDSNQGLPDSLPPSGSLTSDSVTTGSVTGGSVTGDPVTDSGASAPAVTFEAINGASPHFFEVRLDQFDGPIDLLLHLVKKNELSIEKLALAQVASQYLQCLELMEQFDLEIAGEYLVIAATLVSVKSSFLLNEPAKLELDDEGNLFDPHEELLRRLKDAQIYKEGAFHLSCRSVLDIDVFAPPSGLDSFDRPTTKLRDHDAMLLAKAFQRVLSRAGDEPTMTISFQTISIVDRMMTVIETLKGRGGRASFLDLIPDSTSRSSMVASFVALLELCRRSVIKIAQGEAFDEIQIMLVAELEQGATFTSEFDEVPNAETSEAPIQMRKQSGGI
jgi:segregation and condensation protein A